MKKTLKIAKNKVISEKRGAKIAQDKTLNTVATIESLIEQFKGNFGFVNKSMLRKNPYRAETADGLNVAFGKTKIEAVQNLLSGVNSRKN